MTIKEFAELLDVSADTASRAAKQLFPDRFSQGKAASFSLAESKRIIESIKHKGVLTQSSEALPQNAEVTKPENMMSMLRAAADTIEAQQKALLIAAPKVETFNAICDSTNLKSVAEVAQIVGTGRNKLFKLMRTMGIVNEFNRPYQKYIDEGYLQVKDTVKTINGKPTTFPQAFFTGKGELWISRKLSATHQIGAPE